MKIFVTGGSGYIGKHLIASLIEDGHSVAALSRSKRSDSIIEKLGAKPVRGSMEDVSLWKSALSGIECIVHAAAPVSFWGQRGWFHNQIVTASVELLEAAKEAEVDSYIYLSSEAALQDVVDLNNIDETFPYPNANNSIYGESKRLAEQALLTRSQNIRLIILRPTFVWGDESPNLLTIVDKAKSGEFMWIGDARSEFEAIHIENLVSAIKSSITSGSSGSIYFVTDGANYKVKTFFEKVFAQHGVEKKISSVPKSIATGLAIVCEGIWNMLQIKSKPPLLRFEVAFLSQPRRYSIAKAKTELSYNPKPHIPFQE